MSSVEKGLGPDLQSGDPKTPHNNRPHAYWVLSCGVLSVSFLFRTTKSGYVPDAAKFWCIAARYPLKLDTLFTQCSGRPLNVFHAHVLWNNKTCTLGGSPYAYTFMLQLVTMHTHGEQTSLHYMLCGALTTRRRPSQVAFDHCPIP